MKDPSCMERQAHGCRPLAFVSAALQYPAVPGRRPPTPGPTVGARSPTAIDANPAMSCLTQARLSQVSAPIDPNPGRLSIRTLLASDLPPDLLRAKRDQYPAFWPAQRR